MFSVQYLHVYDDVEGDSFTIRPDLRYLVLIKQAMWKK